MWFGDEDEASRLEAQGHRQIEAGDLGAAQRTADALLAMRWSGGFAIEALALASAGDLEAAVAGLEAGVARAPDAWALWQLLGNLRSDLGRLDDAIAAFDRALRCEGASQIAIGFNRAVVHHRADRFGEALHVHALFLRAAKFRNKWNPRTFEEAEEELSKLSPRLTDLAAFAEHAKTLSEDPGTKETGGDLGWVTRGADAVPPSIRETVFHWLGAGGDLEDGGALLGPVRLENGAVLLWVSERREGPAWEQMREIVHRELRARFLRGVLTEADVRTFRD